MEIIVTDLKGKKVETISCTPLNLSSKVEKVKEKYPPGKYHAKLKTY